MCDFGSHGALHGECNGCYAPDGFMPFCPFWEGTNNVFGRSTGSTKGAVLFSLIWMVLFIMVLISTKGRVTKPPAMLFLGMYSLYMIYQFCAAFGAPVAICIDSLNICF